MNTFIQYNYKRIQISNRAVKEFNEMCADKVPGLRQHKQLIILY